MLRNLFFALLLLLSLSARALPQEPRSYLYGFTGPVVVPESAFTRWNGNFLHLGGGGEALITGRFGLGGEAGVLLPTSNQYAVTTSLLSFGPAYHFLPVNSSRRLDPFVNGGPSLLVGSGAGIALNYGGGVNYWIQPRLGLRAEFRDHLWTPESGAHIHLLDFRFGVVFRFH